jgi:hypothetical protein
MIRRAAGRGTKQMLVQAFVVEPAVEALDEPVLLRLARRDVVPCDTTLRLPAQHGVGDQLGAVVADDHRRTAVQRNDLVELTPDAQPRHRGVRHKRQPFPGKVDRFIIRLSSTDSSSDRGHPTGQGYLLSMMQMGAKHREELH